MERLQVPAGPAASGPAGMCSGSPAVLSRMPPLAVVKLRRGSEHRELIRDRELARAEAKDSRRTPAGRPRRPALARVFQELTPDEDALQVRGRDLVAERGGVQLAELGDGERRRREREAQVRVRELGPQPLAPGEHDLAVVESHAREAVDGMPGRVFRHGWVGVGRYEAEVGGSELTLVGVPVRCAPRPELLEVRELADVDLHGEVPPDRRLERLERLEVAAGEGPRTRFGLAGALPEKHLRLRTANSQDGSQGNVGRMVGGFQL